MKSENMKTIATNKIPELAKAFSEDRNQAMSIDLIV